MQVGFWAEDNLPKKKDVKVQKYPPEKASVIMGDTEKLSDEPKETTLIEMKQMIYDESKMRWIMWDTEIIM